MVDTLPGGGEKFEGGVSSQCHRQRGVRGSAWAGAGVHKASFFHFIDTVTAYQRLTLDHASPSDMFAQDPLCFTSIGVSSVSA
jgi:hypothetical protein